MIISRLYQLMSATEYAVGWSQPNTRFATSSVMINSNIELCCSLEKNEALAVIALSLEFIDHGKRQCPHCLVWSVCSASW